MEEGSMDVLGRQKDELVGPRENQAGNISGGKNDKTEAVPLGDIMRRHGSLEKTIMAGK